MIQIEDPADVVVGHFLSQPDFLPEALQSLLVGSDLGADGFQGNEAAQHLVLSLVDLAHAALAQKAYDPETAGNFLTGGKDGGRYAVGGRSPLDRGHLHETLGLFIRIQESLELRAKHRVVSAKLVQISGAVVRREVYDLIEQLLQVIPRRHLLLAEFGEQPGSSNSPISLYRSYGDSQNLGDLFFGAPAEEA